jgi:hypothetical protein
MRYLNPFVKHKKGALFVRKPDSMRVFLELVDENYVLMVFNAHWKSWKSLANRMGLLCFVLQPNGEQKNRKVRDIYVTLKPSCIPVLAL